LFKRALTAKVVALGKFWA